MEVDELAQRINNYRRLEQLEQSPAEPFDPSAGMDADEVRRYVRFLYEQVVGERKNNEELRCTLNQVRGELKAALARIDRNADGQARMMANVERLMKELADSHTTIANLTRQVSILTEQLEVQKNHRFGRKSQKNTVANVEDRHEERDRDTDRQDFDGTNMPAANHADGGDASAATKHTSGIDPNRTGTTYSRMCAERSVEHKSDVSRLPEGSVLIKVETVKSYDEKVEIVEHRYELLIFLGPDGEVHEGYFPLEGDEKGEEYKAYLDKFPGTHASARFLANLAFNKYQMDTPFYREMANILTRRMSTCRQTLINWVTKGAEHLKEVVKVLTGKALRDGAVVNCDETWHRIILDKVKKVYIWCLVNEAEKVVVFFYDNGSRSRESLRKLLGKSRIDALQSDGYNVYMYLDDVAEGTDHLCCLAHARARFCSALEQGKNHKARRFIDLIGELYALERRYKAEGLTAEQILAARQSQETESIVKEIREELLRLKAENADPPDSLMSKALNYLNTFWDQLFRYREDGRYSIDNSVAEQSIRPITVERKNSMFFCSHGGAETSAIYHSIIETCKKQGYSAQEYLEEFFTQIILGRRDYENLLPATIGISKLHKKH